MIKGNNHVQPSRVFIRRWLAALALAALPVIAGAQATATGTQWSTRTATNSSQTATGWQASAAAACEIFRASADSWSTSSAPHTVRIDSTNGVPSLCNIISKIGTVSYSGGFSTQQGAITLPCPAAGTVETRNFTLGYATSPNDTTDNSDITLPPASTCVTGSGNTCGVSRGNVKMVWASLKPTATGLYRISGDFEVTHTGSACTPTTAEKANTDPNAAPPACPGTYGTVNGKAVCIPSTKSTKVVTPAVGQPATAGNPRGGSSAGDKYSDRIPATGGGNGNDGSSPDATDGKSLGTAGSGVPAGTGTTSSNTGGTGTGTSTGGSSLDPSQIKTDCDKYPSSIGCSQYGEPNNSVTLAKSDAGFSSITNTAFATSASCPASLSFQVYTKTYAVSFQPLCDNSQNYIKPVILVLAAAAAAWVFIGGFKV